MESKQTNTIEAHKSTTNVYEEYSTPKKTTDLKMKN